MLDDTQRKLCDDNTTDFSDLKALTINCTLKPSPGGSHTDKLLGVAEAILVRNEVALGYCEGQQIELLGPGTNTNHYAEKIPADGGFALHHVGIMQPGLEASRRAFAEAGVEAVVELGMKIGPLYSVEVVYFDARDELGIYVELLEFRAFGRHVPPGEGMISTIGGLQRRLRGGAR